MPSAPNVYASVVSRVAPAACVVCALTTAGCDEDLGPGTLFDEDGAWSLERFDLDGSGTFSPLDPVRDDTLLLRYWSEQNVVQTAICSDNPDDPPTSSRCGTSSLADWHCRCFAYAFEGEVQRWIEFEVGSTPPTVTIDAGTEGDAGTGTRIELAEVADTSGVYLFSPLPRGVFGSNGEGSRYSFVQKANSVFEPVLTGDERGTCAPCAMLEPQ